jgi:PTH1 family peptidyl-tRNA hydrolase
VWKRQQNLKLLPPGRKKRKRKRKKNPRNELWILMRAIFGLGNPGRKYAGTRHNIGFNIVDFTAENFAISFRSGKGDYEVAETRIGEQKILLVKPTTYMNKSGLAVQQVVDYFALEVRDLLIVCDDYNLPFGTFRFRQGGSDGGHNGLYSIIYELKTDELNRFRFGIGGPVDEAVDFVLSRFDPAEREGIRHLLPIAGEAVKTWIEKGIEATMNSFNRSFLPADDSETC